MLVPVVCSAFCIALASANSSPKALPLKIRKATLQSPDLRTSKRAADLSVSLANNLEYKAYFVEIEVGTPPQTVSLQLDTGSSDLWMMGPGACNISAEQGGCFGGIYDYTKSSSAVHPMDGFSIQYDTPGSGITGLYVQDTVVLNGATLTSVQAAQATQALAVPMGVMGVSFDTAESYIVQNGGSTPYYNMIDQLVEQKVINTHSYSLYLDDREASTGTIIFGGYDTEKYYGSLSALPLQPDANTGEIMSMAVVLNQIAITSSSGTIAIPDSFSFPYSVVLDSGTSLTAIPQDLFNYFMTEFAVEDYDNGLAYLVNCSLLQSTASLDFQFGGAGGPVIQVPVSEYVLPLSDNSGNQLTDDNGQPICQFGMSPTPNAGDFLLGDTFCRSAYIVYDLDLEMIYIAQTKFGATASNIQEIGSSGPPAVTQGSSASAANSATGIIAPGTSIGVGGTSASANPTQSASLGSGGSGNGGIVITSTVQNPAAGETLAAGAGGSASTGAGVPLRVAVSWRVGWVEVGIGGLVVLGVMFGAFY